MAKKRFKNKTKQFGSEGNTRLIYNLKRGNIFRFKNRKPRYKLLTFGKSSLTYQSLQTGKKYLLLASNFRKKVIKVG